MIDLQKHSHRVEHESQHHHIEAFSLTKAFGISDLLFGMAIDETNNASKDQGSY
jgi:hypothetical protein